MFFSQKITFLQFSSEGQASFPPADADGKVLSESHHQKVLEDLFANNSVVTTSKMYKSTLIMMSHWGDSVN